jgi:hypothetical protein
MGASGCTPGSPVLASGFIAAVVDTAAVAC